MPRSILHIDMDAFFASVEQRDQPSLRGRPVIVGGHPTRGVVLAASYEARPLGVRSAMPMSRAVRLAPAAIVVPPRFSAYAQASEQVFRIFEAVTPDIEPLSLDEAFLDVTASVALFGPPAQMASALRERIAREVQLPSSAGIASVKSVAKIASDLAKPNGQKEVPLGAECAFLDPLPVSRLWGVGPRFEQMLHAAGVKTIGDLARTPVNELEQRFGRSGRALWDLAHGRDERPVISDMQAKSFGAEDTFEADIDEPEQLRQHVHSQAWRVGRRLRRAGRTARVVQLKLKYSDFTVVTRRTTLEVPTDDSQALYREAVALLDRSPLPQPVRLTGVSAQDLDSAEDQLELFPSPPPKSAKLNAALDRIAARFGTGAVVTADVSASAPEAARVPGVPSARIKK